MRKFLALLISNIFVLGLFAADATSLVRSVLDKLAPGQWKGSFAFTNYRTDGSKQDYTLDISARDNKTVHIYFSAPAREAGREILNKDGELWSYLPDSRKIIRLADRDSIGNGDFNNADVMKLNWLDDYDAVIA